MGEIVEVEGGGHIVRSKGRKDRHSKVCTAKGPRDRRVRLSALTAIQFYDVQDRLGYDRPSKALDWLIDKAKSAIDQLAQLPPWKPTQQQQQQQNDDVPEKHNPNANQNDTEGLGLGFGFVPSENEIADSIKSFFPATTSFSPIQFHHQPVLFTDGMVAWNGAAIDTGGNGGAGGAGGGGFVFNAPSPLPLPLPSVLFGQSQYLSSQRGPLQSSNNNPTVRAFIDAPSFVAADHRLLPAAMVHQSSSSPVTGFASGGFSGFRVPARIQGDEEYGGVSDKPSSASSDSRR